MIGKCDGSQNIHLVLNSPLSLVSGLEAVRVNLNDGPDYGSHLVYRCLFEEINRRRISLLFLASDTAVYVSLITVLPEANPPQTEQSK